jgi:hypothetical protein
MVHLEPRTYTFGTSSQYSDKQIEVAALLTPDGGLTSDCDEASPLAFTADEFGDYAEIQLTLPPGSAGEVWYVRLAPGDDHRFAIRGGSSRLETSLCLGCTDDCVLLGDRATPPLDAQGVATLRIQLLESSELLSQVSIEWLPKP